METQGHEIRVIRVIRALKHVLLKNTITNKLQNKNRRFPMKKTAVCGWENGGLYFKVRLMPLKFRVYLQTVRYESLSSFPQSFEAW